MAATAAVQAASRRAVPGARAIGAVLGVLGALMRGAEATAGPILDLIIRLWLAQIFFVSGLLKVADWDVAMALASQEYPVTWMAPGLAAVVGAGIEVIGAVLLALGLATRLAALPMLVLSLVIQIEYLALPTHIYWALLFGWIVVRGPGPLSIDGLLGRGFAETAFPLAASLSNLFRAVTR